MTKYIILLFTVFIPTQIFSQTALREKIRQIISDRKADIGVAILHLESGQTVQINGDKHYPMISVFKFHIALTVLHQVDENKLSLDQKIFIPKKALLENTFSPFRDKYPNGNLTISLKEALEWMIIESDNNLCDFLIKLIGGVETVSHFINNPAFIIKNDEEGMHKNWDAQFLNTTTPNFTNKLLKYLLVNQLLSEKTSLWLYKTMVQTSVGKNRIKGKLPSSAEVAHRTGSSFTNDSGLTGAINDIGIIKLPDEDTLIISVFVHNTSEKFKNSEEIIADIAKAAWNHFVANKKNANH
ncbi:class A beta-lactamase [Flavobacterium sp.]|uniref:class A beta-lactamase n=1 Tax=Flavobacterium sp. TaxID=239 RepID=UPI0031D3D33B